jgi:hypothetical protein
MPRFTRYPGLGDQCGAVERQLDTPRLQLAPSSGAHRAISAASRKHEAVLDMVERAAPCRSPWHAARIIFAGDRTISPQPLSEGACVG